MDDLNELEEVNRVIAESLTIIHFSILTEIIKVIGCGNRSNDSKQETRAKMKGWLKRKKFRAYLQVGFGNNEIHDKSWFRDIGDQLSLM